jgi:hypothetical protein
MKISNQTHAFDYPSANARDMALDTFRSKGGNNESRAGLNRSKEGMTFFQA